MSRAVWPCPVCVSFVPSSCVLCLECRVSCCPLACPVGHRTAQSAEKFDKTQPNTHVPISGRVASGIDIPHPVTHPMIARAPVPGSRALTAIPGDTHMGKSPRSRSPEPGTHTQSHTPHISTRRLIAMELTRIGVARQARRVFGVVRSHPPGSVVLHPAPRLKHSLRDSS